MANIPGNFVCPNGHARSNPDERMLCEICGKALGPDLSRGDITPGELAAHNPQELKPGQFTRQRLL